MLELDYKLSTFNDAKIVVLQNADLTADLDETLEVMLLGEHTKDVKAGEVVVIRGSIYYGASNLGKQSKTKKTITLMTAKFVTYEGRQNIDITESDIEAFHRFASLKNHGSNSNDDVIHRLVSMTAPNVIGEEPYKLGILRSIVGGSEGQRRGRIHTLSVGDKGLAKSLVMNEGLKMKPNARKITAQSASSTSALGIVDSTNDVKTLIYGPIPLSSGSMVGIDELQSWTFDNQGILLNVMEEGRFNLLKYARDKEIVAETTILATANPQDIKYEDRTSISVKEINLLAPLLDRFDQIYVSLDEIDEQKDWDYSERRMKYTRERRSHNYHFITNYLVYAQGIEPVLTPEASEMLRKFWIELRKQKLTGRRMLESIFRIAEATTKLRLKKVIDAEIALEAQQSIQVMLVRLGQYVKTIKDPRDAALDEVIGVIENTQTKIAFDEGARLVEDENERVRMWLTGGSGRELNTGYNKKYRELRDRFLQRINQPDSKISVVKMVPLVVVWQTAKAPNIVIDQIDQIDQDQTFDDQKSVLTNGHKITESCDEEKNNDLATFTSTKNEISEVNSRSNRSIRSISSGEKPTYEYLKETDAYRCNWCKCIYLEDTKDTNADSSL